MRQHPNGPSWRCSFVYTSDNELHRISRESIACARERCVQLRRLGRRRSAALVALPAGDRSLARSRRRLPPTGLLAHDGTAHPHTVGRALSQRLRPDQPAPRRAPARLEEHRLPHRRRLPPCPHLPNQREEGRAAISSAPRRSLRSCTISSPPPAINSPASPPASHQLPPPRPAGMHRTSPPTSAAQAGAAAQPPYGSPGGAPVPATLSSSRSERNPPPKRQPCHFGKHLSVGAANNCRHLPAQRTHRAQNRAKATEKSTDPLLYPLSYGGPGGG
jgi:hypothetical protein